MSFAHLICRGDDAGALSNRDPARSGARIGRTASSVALVCWGVGLMGCSPTPGASPTDADFPVLQTYSECNDDDGYWHVVTDGLTPQPPAGLKRTRIEADDIKTTQPCKGDASASLSAAGQVALVGDYLKPLAGDTTCQAPKKISEVIVLACNPMTHTWEYQERAKYQCLDGSYRYDPPTSYQTTQVSCESAPPPLTMLNP